MAEQVAYYRASIQSMDDLPAHLRSAVALNGFASVNLPGKDALRVARLIERGLAPPVLTVRVPRDRGRLEQVFWCAGLAVHVYALLEPAAQALAAAVLP